MTTSVSRFPRIPKARLAAMVEEATVDCYNQSEQISGWFTMIEENLAVPFETVVLGVTVIVRLVDLTDNDQIVASCLRGRHRQTIPILDLPLPIRSPDGWEWIEAIRSKGECRRRSLFDHSGISKHLHVRFIRERTFDEVAKVRGRLQLELLLHPLREWCSNLLLSMRNLRENAGISAVDIEVKEGVVVLDFAKTLAGQRVGDLSCVEWQAGLLRQ